MLKNNKNTPKSKILLGVLYVINSISYFTSSKSASCTSSAPEALP
ncbi:hypothetical protein CHRY9393_03402 [Chryseobacterium fistulae]|uniref:Uncharacterized protein n=1 Tax=Chryseobacterium fistulae TaxID=2675058 RepID=A0A6N4XZ50_9FLAO|nr:hypothetical protein CHRY9393_03402 [Chryseobacterium fistulae]